jgi:hypothetical protein
MYIDNIGAGKGNWQRGKNKKQKGKEAKMFDRCNEIIYSIAVMSI